MKLLIQKYFNMKMKNKLIITYLPLFAITISLIGFISFRLTIDNMYNQSMELNRQALSQVATIVHKNVSYYKTYMKNIYLDNMTVSYLKGNYIDSYEEFKDNDLVTKRLRTLLANQEIPINLSIIRYNHLNEQIQTNFDGVLENRPEFDFLEEAYGYSIQIYNSERFEDRNWFREKKQAFKSQWKQVDKDGLYNNISYLVDVKDLLFGSNDKNIALLKLTMRIEDLLTITEDLKPDSKYPYILYSSDGELIYKHPSMNDIYYKSKTLIDNFSNVDDKMMANSDLILIKEPIEDTEFVLVSVNSVGFVMARIDRVKNLILAISIIVLIIMFALTELISSMYVKRLLVVVEYLKKFHQGDIEEQIPYMHNDEVGYLAESINDMKIEIQQLVHKIIESEMEVKEIELVLLQHQINPHFLYNSLSSISRLAEFGDKDSIKDMVQALVKFYRLTLNNGDNDITIGNELEHVKAYLNVYDIRMGEKFNVVYTVDDSLLNYKTIKVVLQPFVENILEHGMYRRRSPINIHIKIYREKNDIIFEIIDDGIGMSPEKLNDLLKGHVKGRSGYAINNVERRLQMQYGPEYGVSIFSKLAIGTQVVLRIPIPKGE